MVEWRIVGVERDGKEQKWRSLKQRQPRRASGIRRCPGALLTSLGPTGLLIRIPVTWTPAIAMEACQSARSLRGDALTGRSGRRTISGNWNALLKQSVGSFPDPQLQNKMIAKPIPRTVLKVMGEVGHHCFTASFLSVRHFLLISSNQACPT